MHEPGELHHAPTGSHTFACRGTDAAGNVGAPAAVTWNVDTRAPVVTFSTGPASVTTATSASFSFAADKPGVGFSCALDAAAFAACSSPRELARLSAGTHLFTVQATDPAGNIGKASYSWTIDLTAPTTPTGLTANGVSPNGIDLGWKPSTDNVAVAAYVIFRNGGRLATVAAPAASYQDRSGLTPSTAYTYTVAAVDAAGNNSSQSAPAKGATMSTPIR